MYYACYMRLCKLTLSVYGAVFFMFACMGLYACSAQIPPTPTEETTLESRADSTSTDNDNQSEINGWEQSESEEIIINNPTEIAP